MPYASSLAMTRTAQYAIKQIIKEMNRQFDRPKPSTVDEKRGPLYLKTASTSRWPNDYAEVRVKDAPLPKGVSPLTWLSHNLRGSIRPSKRGEDLMRKSGILPSGWYYVPGEGARMDKYGNISAGQIQQILAALKSSRDSLQNTRYGNEGITYRKGNTSSRSANQQKKYFLANKTSNKTKHLEPGVWQRYGRKDWQVKPVLIFVKGAPRYKRRIKFFDIAAQAAQYRFKLELKLAMSQAVRTARVE